MRIKILQIQSLVTCLFVLCSLPGFAKVQRTVNATEEGIQLVYSFGDLQLKKSPIFSDAFIPVLNGVSADIGEGKPMLPRIIESFEIPTGMEIGSIQIKETLDTIHAKCAPTIPVRLEKDTSTQVLPIQPYSGIWPVNSAEQIGIGVYRDIRIGRLRISPVRYSYEKQEFLFSKSLKVNITFKEQTNPKVKSASSVAIHDISEKDLLQRISITSNRLSERVISRSRGPMPEEAPWLLIITPSIFKQEVERFAAWKRRMGFNVKIEAVENASNLHNPNYTFSLIKGMYDTNSKLEYVLLIGDGQHIQPQKGKVTGGFQNIYYTDFYFSCMDGEDDIYADLNLGRIPVVTNDQLKIVFDKTIEFEKNPYQEDDGFYSTGIHIAEWGEQKATLVRSKDTRNFIWTSEKSKEVLNTLGYNITRIYNCTNPSVPRYYPDGTILPLAIRPGYYNWNRTPSDITTAINKGAWYVLSRCHADTYTWSTIGFNGDHASGLKNGKKLPLVFSINCESASFYNTDRETSLAERLLWNPNGGAVGIIGAAYLSATKFNDFMTFGLFEAFYPCAFEPVSIPGIESWMGSTQREEYRLGNIFNVGNYWMSEQYNLKPNETDLTSALCQYNCEIFHCLGDPTLPFNKKLPIKDDLQKYFSNSRGWNADGRYLVMVYDNNDNPQVKILKGFGWENVSLSNKLSIVGKGYVPELLENYEASRSAQNKISDITTNGELTTVQFSTTDGTGMISQYDDSGNLLSCTEGIDGKATMKTNRRTAVITLSVNSTIADSKVVKITQ